MFISVLSRLFLCGVVGITTINAMDMSLSPAEGAYQKGQLEKDKIECLLKKENTEYPASNTRYCHGIDETWETIFQRADLELKKSLELGYPYAAEAIVVLHKLPTLEEVKDLKQSKILSENKKRELLYFVEESLKKRKETNEKRGLEADINNFFMLNQSQTNSTLEAILSLGDDINHYTTYRLLKPFLTGKDKELKDKALAVLPKYIDVPEVQLIFAQQELQNKQYVPALNLLQKFSEQHTKADEFINIARELSFDKDAPKEVRQSSFALYKKYINDYFSKDADLMYTLRQEEVEFLKETTGGALTLEMTAAQASLIDAAESNPAALFKLAKSWFDGLELKAGGDVKKIEDNQLMPIVDMIYRAAKGNDPSAISFIIEHTFLFEQNLGTYQICDLLFSHQEIEGIKKLAPTNYRDMVVYLLSRKPDDLKVIVDNGYLPAINILIYDKLNSQRPQMRIDYSTYSGVRAASLKNYINIFDIVNLKNGILKAKEDNSQVVSLELRSITQTIALPINEAEAKLISLKTELNELIGPLNDLKLKLLEVMTGDDLYGAAMDFYQLHELVVLKYEFSSISDALYDGMYELLVKASSKGSKEADVFIKTLPSNVSFKSGVALLVKEAQ